MRLDGRKPLYHVGSGVVRFQTQSSKIAPGMNNAHVTARGIPRAAYTGRFHLGGGTAECEGPVNEYL